MPEVAKKKMWYTSKTEWLNILALIGMFVQAYTKFVIPPEAEIAALAIINIILRSVTTEPLDWGIHLKK